MFGEALMTKQTESIEQEYINEALTPSHEYPIVERTEVAQLGKTAVEGSE
jgi:hypothetical protein